MRSTVARQLSDVHSRRQGEFQAHAELVVEGMTCGSWAARVQRAISLPGVSDAGVNFATGRANVDYDATGRDEFEEAVSRAGYTLQATSRRRIRLFPAVEPANSSVTRQS